MSDSAFLQRFSGKTSTLTKGGIGESIKQDMTPVNKLPILERLYNEQKKHYEEEQASNKAKKPKNKYGYLKSLRKQGTTTITNASSLIKGSHSHDKRMIRVWGQKGMSESAVQEGEDKKTIQFYKEEMEKMSLRRKNPSKFSEFIPEIQSNEYMFTPHPPKKSQTTSVLDYMEPKNSLKKAGEQVIRTEKESWKAISAPKKDFSHKVFFNWHKNDEWTKPLLNIGTSAKEYLEKLREDLLVIDRQLVEKEKTNLFQNGSTVFRKPMPMENGKKI